MTSITTLSGTNSSLPNIIKVENLAIAVYDETNNSLNLDHTQYLIVGEKTDNIGYSSNSLFSLLVDEQGVAINTSFAERSNVNTTSALYVDGDVFFSGSILGPAWSNLVGSNYIASNAGWFTVVSDSVVGLNNIYTTGNVTLGNLSAASGNSNTLNIVDNITNYSINNAQVSLQNLQNSQFRTAIIGNSNASPIVMNTTPGTGALEFHMSRDQGYFSNIYSNIAVGSNYDVPVYASVADSPHLRLDTIGNVGIHTSANRPLSYNLRIPLNPDPLSSASVAYNQPAALHVEGTMYACNIVMTDYKDLQTKSLDQIYIRQFGVTIPASQIAGGTINNNYTSNFGDGDFQMQNNLIVLGNETLRGDLNVNGGMCNVGSVYMQEDLDVGGTLFISGAMYKYYSNINGSNVLTSNAIQFQLAGSNLTSFNYWAGGITLAGAFGVGVSLSDSRNVNIQNPTPSQLVSRKNAPSIWELELTDLTSLAYTKSAYFGHPSQDGTLSNLQNPGNTVVDGSLVIATPSSSNTYYSAGANNYLPQNIYFFPGRDANTIPFLTASVPPTLAVFTTKQVGINTYIPFKNIDGLNAAFSVAGDIVYSGKLYVNSAGQIQKVAQFIENDYYPTGSGLYYAGIQYISSNAPYVGINTGANNKYGLTIAGGLQSINGYYTPDGHLFRTWYDSSYLLPTGDIAPQSNISASNIFAWGNVGIGVPVPSVALSVKDNSGTLNAPTCIQLVKPDRSSLTNIMFLGANSNEWDIQVNHSANTLSIGNNTNPLTLSSNIRGFMVRQTLSQSKPQTFIGTNAYGLIPNIYQSPDPYASLTVGGNLAVMGDVNITGAFRINGSALSNAAVSNIYGGISNVNIDSQTAADVYVGGRYIQLDFNVSRDATYGRGVVVGNPFPINGSNTLISAYDKNTALRVYSSYGGTLTNNQLTPVATFQSAGSNSIIEFVALCNMYIPNIDPRNQKVSMGLFTAASNTSINQNYTFAILDGQNSPYMTFYNVPNTATRYTGLNNLNPTALFHIQAGATDYGSNMLRLTKPIAGNNDTTSVAPQLDLQKTYTSRLPTTWSFAGPNAAWNQKLSLLYSDCNVTSQQELYTFTNNGCVGIGSTQPIYALDISSTGTKGSLRLWDPGNNGVPSILFQTGTDDIFGNENTPDYRMATSNGQFYFESYTSNNRFEILNVLANGNIGLGGLASAQYNINIGGDVNIEKQLYVGANIGSLSGSSNNLFINAPNISLNAYNQLTNPYGSVGINMQIATSNLFYIHSGVNQNLMVLDSSFPQAQVHFRTQQTNAIYDMWRMDANTSNFEWKYYPNYGSALYIPDTDSGYINAFSFGVSTRPAGSAEFDTTLFGSMILNSTQPNIIFGSCNLSSSPAPYITSSNYALTFVAPSNIGIGTNAPQGAFAIYNSIASNTLFRIDQNGYGDMLNLYSKGQKMVSVTSNGYIGVGTSNPIAPLMIVASNQTVLPINTPSSNVPIAFAVQQLGQFGNIAHLYNYSNEGVMVNNVGYVGINTLFPQSNLHVVGNVLIAGTTSNIGNSYFGQNIEVFGNAVAHGNNVTDSDRRIKSDLVQIDNALEKVKKLTGYTFTNIQSGMRNTGLVAQDVLEVLPEAVYQEGKYLGLAYGNIMGLIVEAIKDLSTEIQSIKDRLPA